MANVGHLDHGASAPRSIPVWSWLATKNRGYYLAGYVILVLLGLWTAFPVYWQLATSLRSDADLYTPVVALILNGHIRARHFWRSLLFLPWAIPAVVAAYTWKFIYNDVNGVANAMLTNIGLIDAPILFLAKPENALWSVLVGVIWQGAPFWTMTFLAGLQSIPGELYEAAEIDGATTLKSFLHITLPSISSVIVVTVMLSTIWTTNGIEFIYTLTNGGPGGATETFPLLAIAQGLRAYDLGIGSTIPLLFFPIFGVMIYFLTKRLLSNEEV